MPFASGDGAGHVPGPRVATTVDPPEEGVVPAFPPLRPPSPPAAPAAALAAALLLVASALPGPLGAATVHRQRAPDGGVVFSDAPLGADGFVRRSYRGDYGRPTATASCRGLGTDDLLARAERWRALATEAAERHGLDPELVLAVARVESCFDPGARSVAGAEGLMQLMEGTARELGVEDRRDPRASLDGGSRYLARMLARFDGDLTLALAAYNAGPGNVERHGGLPPFPETRDYVARVTRLYRP